MANQDIFGKKAINLNFSPVTADLVEIQFDGKLLSTAINFSLSYAQSVNRRHSIGNRDAIIYPSQPVGQISIQRMLTADLKELMSGKIWKACDNGGTISFALKTGCIGTNVNKVATYTCTGCVATQYQLNGEAEGLSIVDGVTIEFMQLFMS